MVVKIQIKKKWDVFILAVEFLLLRFIRLIWTPEIKRPENLNGKTAIVTGANTGLGKSTTRKLVERGATVIMACRNLTEGQKTLDEIKSQTGKDKLILLRLDLTDLSSVQEFAAEVNKNYPKIHILVNNAGLVKLTPKLECTAEGFELHMGVNHLGHFLLTNLLLENLKRSGSSRVVTVASHAIFGAKLDIDDLMLENTDISSDTFLPYANSKLANCLFTTELAKRLQGTGVTTYAICPGLVSTDVFRNMTKFDQLKMKIEIVLFGVSSDVGCEATMYCAVSQDCKTESGNVYHYNKKLSVANKALALPEVTKAAKQLWEKSEQLVNLKKHL